MQCIVVELKAKTALVKDVVSKKEYYYNTSLDMIKPGDVLDIDVKTNKAMYGKVFITGGTNS